MSKIKDNGVALASYIISHDESESKVRVDYYVKNHKLNHIVTFLNGNVLNFSAFKRTKQLANIKMMLCGVA